MRACSIGSPSPRSPRPSEDSKLEPVHQVFVLKEIAERLLVPAGFAFSAEELDVDDFGSCFAVYSRSSEEVRLVWDGRDGWGFLEYRPLADATWEPLGLPVAEGEPWEMKKAALEEWRAALAPVL